MLTYRLYFLDGLDHFVSVELFKCIDDDEAKTVANQYVNGSAVELWQGRRLVARYELSSAKTNEIDVGRILETALRQARGLPD